MGHQQKPREQLRVHQRRRHYPYASHAPRPPRSSARLSRSVDAVPNSATSAYERASCAYDRSAGGGDRAPQRPTAAANGPYSRRASTYVSGGGGNREHHAEPAYEALRRAEVVPQREQAAPSTAPCSPRCSGPAWTPCPHRGTTSAVHASSRQNGGSLIAHSDSGASASVDSASTKRAVRAARKSRSGPSRRSEKIADDEDHPAR